MSGLVVFCAIIAFAFGFGQFRMWKEKTWSIEDKWMFYSIFTIVVILLIVIRFTS